LFLIDFELEKPRAWLLDQVNPVQMLYDVNGFSNDSVREKSARSISIEKHPITLEEYRHKFIRVYNHLKYGDSFLVNLTIRTKLKINSSLKDLFYQSDAHYKRWLHNELLFFSPEIFVQIRNGKIIFYPMKGTIDASIHDAARHIIENKKELAE